MNNYLEQLAVLKKELCSGDGTDTYMRNPYQYIKDIKDLYYTYWKNLPVFKKSSVYDIIMDLINNEVLVTRSTNIILQDLIDVVYADTYIDFVKYEYLKTMNYFTDNKEKNVELEKVNVDFNRTNNLSKIDFNIDSDDEIIGMLSKLGIINMIMLLDALYNKTYFKIK